MAPRWGLGCVFPGSVRRSGTGFQSSIRRVSCSVWRTRVWSRRRRGGNSGWLSTRHRGWSLRFRCRRSRFGVTPGLRLRSVRGGFPASFCRCPSRRSGDVRGLEQHRGPLSRSSPAVPVPGDPDSKSFAVVAVDAGVPCLEGRDCGGAVACWVRYPHRHAVFRLFVQVDHVAFVFGWGGGLCSPRRRPYFGPSEQVVVDVVCAAARALVPGAPPDGLERDVLEQARSLLEMAVRVLVGVRLFFVDGPRGFCQRHGKSYLTRRRRGGEGGGGGGGGLLTGRPIPSAYRWAWCPAGTPVSWKSQYASRSRLAS